MFAFYSLADATPQFLLETKPLLIFNVVLTLEIEKKTPFPNISLRNVTGISQDQTYKSLGQNGST